MHRKQDWILVCITVSVHMFHYCTIMKYDAALLLLLAEQNEIEKSNSPIVGHCSLQINQWQQRIGGNGGAQL